MNALFGAGQSGMAIDQPGGLYEGVDDREMKGQITPLSGSARARTRVQRSICWGSSADEAVTAAARQLVETGVMRWDAGHFRPALSRARLCPLRGTLFRF
jgi:hypothetical protein